MSSDWWTSSSSASSFSTPHRPSTAPLAPRRFAPGAGDELDPADVRMAESVRFLPTFASSPAGKLALGQSPGGGGSSPLASGTGAAMSMGMGMTPGAAGKRSPRDRFAASATPYDGASPRTGRQRHSLIGPSALASQGYDDDLPPTASLHDSALSSPPSSVTTTTLASSALTSSLAIPAPPSLTPSSSTVRLHIFGPPPAHLPALRPWLEQCGHVLAYTPGPDGSNWFVVEYAAAQSAAFALRRHGEVVSGRWMVGVSVVKEGSTLGFTAGPESAGDGLVVPQGPGTPMRVQKVDVMRSKAVSSVVKNGGDEYAWDEDQPAKGWLNKAAELVFGR